MIVAVTEGCSFTFDLLAACARGTSNQSCILHIGLYLHCRYSSMQFRVQLEDCARSNTFPSSITVHETLPS